MGGEYGPVLGVAGQYDFAGVEPGIDEMDSDSGTGLGVVNFPEAGRHTAVIGHLSLVEVDRAEARNRKSRRLEDASAEDHTKVGGDPGQALGNFGTVEVAQANHGDVMVKRQGFHCVEFIGEGGMQELIAFGGSNGSVGEAVEALQQGIQRAPYGIGVAFTADIAAEVASALGRRRSGIDQDGGKGDARDVEDSLETQFGWAGVGPQQSHNTQGLRHGKFRVGSGMLSV